ncbi:MAG: fumarylacetoacetate hydrolase family protein [Chloroflexota bacterium]
MKLVTYTIGNSTPQLGVLSGGNILNLHTASGGTLPNDMLSFLQMGDDGLVLAQSIADSGGEGIPEGDVKLMSPISNPSKVVAIGLNYMDHVIESGVDVPAKPTMFCKYPSSIVGPGDDIRWTEALSTEVDYEAELAFIIGKRAKNVSEADAFEYIAGYLNCHDVSARDLQMAPGDQWIRGKSLDTFCPLGPYLVTKDEIADPHNLSIKCLVNGEALQDSSTKHLIFKIPFLMSYLTQAFTLEPGDVVTTGTPDGVGFARKPPIFLKDGDVCTVEVEGLGQLTNPCVIE